MDRDVPWTGTSAPQHWDRTERSRPRPLARRAFGRRASRPRRSARPAWASEEAPRPASAAAVAVGEEGILRKRRAPWPARASRARPDALARYGASPGRSRRLRRRRRTDGTVHVGREHQFAAHRDPRAIQAAQLDLRDVDDASHLGDPLEELAELMVASLRVHRDGDLAVVVADDRRARLEERDTEPRCRGAVGDCAVEGGNLLLARQPVLQRVEARLELRGLA